MKGLVAKITPPKADGLLLRKRLFSLLDKGRKKRVIWVSGAAGSGKTTLVASYLAQRRLPLLWYQVDQGDTDISTFFYYMGLAAATLSGRRRKALPLLTPEYLQSVPLFTRRYFEELYRRVSPPLAIVFDDFQDCRAAGFHELISRGLETAPEGVNVFILSRETSPLQFARLRASGMISFIGWNELSFTPGETGSFLRLNAGRSISRDSAARLHEKTDGWAAGLRLIAESVRTEKVSGDIAAQKYLEASTPSEIFDYFASVVFGTSSPETQEFLLKTAFLPAVTEQSAQQLTAHSQPGTVLSGLSRSHSFIEWRSLAEPVYQYHPLFREFLLSRAEEYFDRARVRELRTAAAKALAAEGRIEAAVTLFKEAQEWDGLIDLLLVHAQSFVAQGRTRSLQEWIAAIPPEFAAGTAWLFYWSGVCRLTVDPGRAREDLQRAFGAFRKNEDLTGSVLCGAAIVETFVYEWNDFTPLDYWIRELEKYVRPGQVYPDPETELRAVLSIAVALMIRRPDHPGIAGWFEQLADRARRTANENLMLNATTWASNYYFWIGDHVRGRSLLAEVRKLGELPEASPLARLTWMWMEAATRIVFEASPREALHEVSRSLQYGRDTGIHLWDHMLFALGVHASLIEDDFVTAASFLEMSRSILESSRRHGYCHYHYLSSWFHLLKGDLALAATDAGLALELAEETGFVFPVILCCLLAAQVYHDQSRDREARLLIRRAALLCRRTKNMILNYMCDLARANLEFDSHRDEAGLKLLAQAMRLGSEKGYTYLPWMYQPSVMSKLCARALESGIEVDYVQGLVRKFRLSPGQGRAAGENWPWPLKIYTLGSFRILLDDKPLVFEGKVQQKPLALLKMLIAFGGSDVAENRVIDLLWPDADGDSAHKSLEVTLGRLRRLLGRSGEAVLYRGGLLSLDPKSCWVDALDVAGKARAALQLWRSPGSGRVPLQLVSEAVQLSESALALYHGAFLEAETGRAWVVPLREKLKSAMLAVLMSLGLHRAEEKKWGRALEYFERGLALDNIAEDFYRCLIVCYEKLGRRAEAARAYRQCCAVLSETLGITPSEETTAVYLQATRQI